MEKKFSDQSSQCFQSGVGVFGDAWTLMILNVLELHGECRFSELQRSIKGISPVTLSARLKKLEMCGTIERIEETIDKLSVSYRLTRKGRDMGPVLAAIRHYADKYF